MARIKVAAVFWRRVLEATHKTLHGDYKGQYHIAIPADVGQSLEVFIEDLERYDPTGHDGFSVDVPVARFDGEHSVDEQFLKLRYMGPESQRKDWNFPGQSTNPYPLWAPKRGVSDQYDSSVSEYIMLIRDDLDTFHARWQRGTSDLPEPLRGQVKASDCGVWIQEA